MGHSKIIFHYGPTRRILAQGITKVTNQMENKKWKMKTATLPTSDL